jgi:chromosome segregation ATPase
MSSEIMLLGVLIGITLLGYMIAINSHGPTRLSVSYLIATLILAGTVWAIVQYVNYGADKKQQERIMNLQLEKQQIEDRARNQEQSFMENRKKIEAANKVKELINQGAGYASTMINVDLRDFSTELDELVGRANSMKNNIAALETAFENLKNEKSQFPGTVPTINEALSNLNEAAKYYRLYFRAEDSAQEEIRERVMRQKAREAEDLFKKASSQIASSM